MPLVNFNPEDNKVLFNSKNIDAIVVNKFGKATVGTTFVPIAFGNVYQTPQVASKTKLRVKAGNANDTAAGSGARKVTIVGLDDTGTLTEEDLTTAGDSASSNSTNDYIRLFRAFVKESGTYATTGTGSHSANIVIENAAGSADWLTIDTAAGYEEAQSNVACYSIPLGYTGFLLDFRIQVASTKVVDAILFKREGILETAAPYKAFRCQEYFSSITDNGLSVSYGSTPLRFPELTDIGFMAKVAASTEDVSAQFNLVLVDNTELTY